MVGPAYSNWAGDRSKTTELKIPYHDETSVIKGNQSNKIELKIEISKTGVDKGNHLEALNPLLKKKVSSIDIDENPRLKAH